MWGVPCAAGGGLGAERQAGVCAVDLQVYADAVAVVSHPQANEVPKEVPHSRNQ